LWLNSALDGAWEIKAMTDAKLDTAQWLPAARAGSSEALGQVLETCRGYLLLIAQQELDTALQAKGGASDLVQQTFLEAQRDFTGFQGTTHAALLAWMRQLLINNLANFRRDFHRDKRRVTREIAMPTGNSSRRRGGGLDAGAATPSVEMMRNEQTEALERALARLPEDYRRVIQMRYREERSFEAIAEQMQRSQNAVRKLWSRAIERLQQEMDANP
jgi:RNA polymerase sigma-70 factor (ECF subfamily)